jgi:NAD-dependent DNA ligase
MPKKITELNDYRRYTKKQEIDKAFHTLEGILKGINIDNEINQTEIEKLRNWCGEYFAYINRSPFSEVINLINFVLEDNVVTKEEYDDLVWVCNNIITPNKYYDAITADMQRLQGILHGILSDNIITKEEMEGLKDWIEDRPDLIGVYPYDEIETLLFSILEDGKVTSEEQDLLKVYFSQFVDIKNTAINQNELETLRRSMSIPLICTMNATINFHDKLFCFTGISSRGKRQDIAEKIILLGGKYNDSMIRGTNYLVIGDKNNPCWVFSCYGRKIERAIEDRAAGLPIQIIKEIDFWDEADSRLR